MSWFYMTMSLNWWLALRLESLSATTLLFTSMFVVNPGADVGAGKAALALLYSMAITRSLNMLIRSAVDLELGMNAVERIHHYSAEIAQEAPHDDPPPGKAGAGAVPRAGWPTRGEVSVKNLSVRYRAGLDLVLKDLSPSRFCGTLFHIERAALHSYGPDPHSC